MLDWLRRLFGGSQDAQNEGADAYHGLRNQVLGITPSDLGVGGSSQSCVIAVLMETAYPDAVATLVAVADGTASLYFSNGGGIIGAGQHEPVRAVSTAFVNAAQDFLSHSAPVETYPLPERNKVRFYFVTGGGVLTSDGIEDDLGHGRHAFSPLFHKGHELIAAIREHSPE